MSCETNTFEGRYEMHTSGRMTVSLWRKSLLTTVACYNASPRCSRHGHWLVSLRTQPHSW